MIESDSTWEKHLRLGSEAVAARVKQGPARNVEQMLFDAYKISFSEPDLFPFDLPQRADEMRIRIGLGALLIIFQEQGDVPSINRIMSTLEAAKLLNEGVPIDWRAFRAKHRDPVIPALSIYDQVVSLHGRRR